VQAHAAASAQPDGKRGNPQLLPLFVHPAVAHTAATIRTNRGWNGRRPDARAAQEECETRALPEWGELRPATYLLCRSSLPQPADVSL